MHSIIFGRLQFALFRIHRLPVHVGVANARHSVPRPTEKSREQPKAALNFTIWCASERENYYIFALNFLFRCSRKVKTLFSVKPKLCLFIRNRFSRVCDILSHAKLLQPMQNIQKCSHHRSHNFATTAFSLSLELFPSLDLCRTKKFLRSEDMRILFLVPLFICRFRIDTEMREHGHAFERSSVARTMNFGPLKCAFA